MKCKVLIIFALLSRNLTPITNNSEQAKLNSSPSLLNGQTKRLGTVATLPSGQPNEYKGGLNIRFFSALNTSL